MGNRLVKPVAAPAIDDHDLPAVAQEPRAAQPEQLLRPNLDPDRTFALPARQVAQQVVGESWDAVLSRER